MYPSPTMTHAWIRLRELRIDNASIGALPHERTVRQEVRVDAALYLSIAAAAHSDEVAATIDYVKVAEHLQATTLAKHYALLETLAEDLARALLDEFALAQQVSVEVHKPAALRNGFVSVAVERFR